MHNDMKNRHQAGDIVKSAMPPRSRLYSLKPIEIESSKVESLTSYIMRLADAHSNTPYMLIHKEIAPLLHRSYLNRNGILVGPFGQGSAALNGISPTARLLVQVLEQLTLRKDLRFLTMLTFAGVLSQRDLVRRTQAWCPRCYEEWRATGKVIYTPLLWTFELIKCCPWHRIPLQLHCLNPDCARTISPFNLCGQIGYCPHCGKWLGTTSPMGRESWPAFPPEELEWQIWAASIVGEMLAAAPSISSPPSLVEFAASIAVLVSKKAGGSPFRLAQQLHVHEQSIYAWRGGQKAPQLDSLVQISACLRLSPMALLTSDIKKGSPGLNPIPPDEVPLHGQSRKQRRLADSEQIKSALEEALEHPEDPPLSLRKLARRLGYQADNLAKLFPRQCSAISQQYREYRSNKRKEGVQRRCEQVQQTVQMLLDQDRYPSKCQVELVLKKPAIFRESAVKSAWLEALQKAGVTD